MSSAELNELRNMNHTQADRIRALTLVVDKQGASCEDTDAIIEEVAHLRQENDELHLRVNELNF